MRRCADRINQRPQAADPSLLGFWRVSGSARRPGVRGQFRPIVADDHPGPSAALDQRRQLPRHAAARDRGVCDYGQAFSRDIVYDVQHPEPSPAGELVMHEVKRPTGIGPRLDQDRGPCADGLAACFAFTGR